MKRNWLIIVAATVALALVTGCGNANGDSDADAMRDTGAHAIEDSAWQITIVSPTGHETVMTIESIKAMPAVDMEAELRGEAATYTGVLLGYVLGEAGIEEADTVTVTAADEYSASITGEVAFSENTILAYAQDDKDMSGDKESGPLRLITTDDTPQVWVGQIIVITVE